MRQLTISLFICLSIACATTKKTNAKSNFLNGTWIPIRQEMAGTSLPAISFKMYRLTIADSIYTYGIANTDKGITTYGKGKMDIYGKEGVNAGKHYTAIYKLENEQLTICYNLSGHSYPETFETKGKPLYFVSVFKKQMIK